MSSNPQKSDDKNEYAGVCQGLMQSNKMEGGWPKAELPQLNHTQFICRINFTNKKVGQWKN